jgi:N-acetylmuramic acid 6-phosphate etherase
MHDRSNLLTEQRLSESMELDRMSIEQILDVMNRQDAMAVAAVGREAAGVARAVELVVQALGAGGRLLYFGAGTSGRLGVLDASECPPTFRSDPSMVQGIIAGGEQAMFSAQEGAEDSEQDGARQVEDRNVGPNDVVMGIAAGGTTPFVHGALRAAAARGAKTVFLTCVDGVADEPPVDVIIRPLTGPEVLTGSTRLKAGTATKLVLNQITTAAMVRLGKCHQNLMVDLKCSNAKLWERGTRIVMTLTGLDRPNALALLQRAQGHVKSAIVMHHRQVDLTEATSLLTRANGHLRAALESSHHEGTKGTKS